VNKRNKSQLFELCFMFVSLSMFSSLVGGRIICLHQKFVSKVMKLGGRATGDAEWAKRKVAGTSQHLQKLSNSDNVPQSLEMSEQEQHKGILPRDKRHEEYGQDSCGPTNDDASVNEPESELKSWEGSSDEDETVFLRKLEAEAMKTCCITGTSNKAEEIPHSSDIDISEQQMKQNKRKMRVERVSEEYEGNRNKRLKIEVWNEVPEEPKDVDREGGCSSGTKTWMQSEEVKEPKDPGLGQAARLSLSAGFVWDADPALLPAAAAARRSDSSSDEEEASKVEEHRFKFQPCLY
jgi:hypothetical protein